MKSRIMLEAIHRGLHCLPKCLFEEKVQQNNFSLLKTAKVVVSYSKYSNVFVLTLCMLSNVFCPKHCLNLTDLSPSGPAKRFAEPDLGLNCLYDHSQKFSF